MKKTTYYIIGLLVMIFAAVTGMVVYECTVGMTWDEYAKLHKCYPYGDDLDVSLDSTVVEEIDTVSLSDVVQPYTEVRIDNADSIEVTIKVHKADGATYDMPVEKLDGTHTDQLVIKGSRISVKMKK